MFVQSGAVSDNQVALWLGTTPQEAARQVEALSRELAERGSGLTVQRVSGGVRLTTDPALHDELAARLEYRGPEPLSHAGWEVLAVVAYRQPITRMEIEALRQTGSERAIETLVQRELIEEVGRKETPGRPILYGTTPQFLAQFGLNSIEDLPTLSAESSQEA